PAAQLDEKLAWPLLMARSEPIADASLPDMRARSSPGTAIAAMMPMIATTISSSMSVKPLVSRILMIRVLLISVVEISPTPVRVISSRDRPRAVDGVMHRSGQDECLDRVAIPAAG